MKKIDISNVRPIIIYLLVKQSTKMPKLVLKNLDKKVITYEEYDFNKTVKDLKDQMSQDHNLDGDIKIIYIGKVLQDKNTIASYNIKEGAQLVFVVNKKKVDVPQPEPTPVAPSPPTPVNQADPTPAPVQNAGAQQNVIAGLSNNPQIMQNVMHQSLLQILSSHPQMQQIRQQDPAGFDALVNSPSFIQQVMQFGMAQQGNMAQGNLGNLFGIPNLSQFGAENVDGNTDDDEENDNSGSIPGIVQVDISDLTEEDNTKIRQIHACLSAYNVPLSDVVQTYIACGKDEEATASTLMDEYCD
jgi:hypothetical protein